MIKKIKILQIQNMTAKYKIQSKIASSRKYKNRSRHEKFEKGKPTLDSMQKSPHPINVGSRKGEERK